MHLLLRATLLLRLSNVMRVDACGRHSEYSRVVHGLVAPRSLARCSERDQRSEPGATASIRPASDIGKSFAEYYHRSRTHLALEKDSPEHRPVQPPDAGGIIAIPEVGGLHHRYERRAA